MAEAPRELCTIFALRWAPPAPCLPPELHGKPIAVFFVCYQGPLYEGERVLNDLRKFGEPLADVVMPKPFNAHQSMLDAVQPPGRNYYWKSEDLPELTDGAIDVIVEHSNAITSPNTIVPIFQLGGADADIDADATAYSHRKAAYALNCNVSWEDGDPEPHVKWARDFSEALEPHSMGVYVNFLGQEGEDRARAAYGPEKYARLVDLKDRYDPTNFFRVNQNIRPSSQGA